MFGRSHEEPEPAAVAKLLRHAALLSVRDTRLLRLGCEVCLWLRHWFYLGQKLLAPQAEGTEPLAEAP